MFEIHDFGKLSKLLKKPFNSKNAIVTIQRCIDNCKLYATIRHEKMFGNTLSYAINGIAKHDDLCISTDLGTLKELISINQPMQISHNDVCVNGVHRQSNSIRVFEFKELSFVNKDEISFLLNTKDFLYGFNKTKAFITADVDRSILFNVALNNKRFAATDGKFVAYIKNDKLTIPENVFDFIIPAYYDEVLNKYFDGSVNVSKLSVPNMELLIRHIVSNDDKSVILDYVNPIRYPQVEKAFESNRQSKQFYIARKALINALSNCYKMSNHEYNACRFDFMANDYTLELAPSNVSGRELKLCYDETAKWWIGFSNNNKFMPTDFSIRFDGKRMVKLLENMEDDFIVIDFSEERTNANPIHFYEEKESLKDNWYLQMPLRS